MRNDLPVSDTNDAVSGEVAIGSPPGVAASHAVQFYDDDRVLVDAVVAFIGNGLRAGAGVVAIVTAEHRRALGTAGFDFTAPEASSGLILLDAEATLSRLLADGRPDAGCFEQVVGTVVERAGHNRRGVRVFGEMVALVRAAGNPSAALRLEELWNEFMARRGISLLCAYPLDVFDSAGDVDAFQQVCRCHGRVLPIPSPGRDESDEKQNRTVAVLQQKAKALVSEAGERRRVEERLAAELADSRLLQTLSAELVSEHDIGRLYEKLVDAAVRIMRSDFASMQMFYPEREPRGALRLLASRGFSAEARRGWEWVSHDTASSCGEVLRSGRRVIATDVEKCEFLIRMGGLQSYLGAGIRAMQSTPLISRSGKLVGMISTHWRQPHEPSERDLRVFDILVRQAADVVERMQAEERLRQSEERLAADLDAMTRLYELGNRCGQVFRTRGECLAAILELALSLGGADKGSIHLADKYSGALALEAQRGLEPALLEFFGQRERDSPAAATRALSTATRVVVEDVATSELLAGQPARSVLLGAGVRAVHSTPLISSTGNVQGVISTYFAKPGRPTERVVRLLDLLARQAADYLERIEADRRLRTSEEKYRDLFDSITQGFCTIEVIFEDDGKPVDFRFLLVNSAFERQTGITQAAGRRMREIAPLHEEHWFQAFGRIALTGEALRFENEAAQLNRHYEVYAWRIGEPAERKVGILFNDITDRRRMAESERRLAAIVEHSRDAIISIDLDAIILSWNQGAKQLYGYTEEEVLGQPVRILIPENRENEEPLILERITRGESVRHYETVRRRKDGSLVDISLSVSPLKDAFGRVQGASKVARDITEKVRARETLERTVAERTAQLRDTVAELEAFSYSIAHDMRAPLRAMTGYARILEEDFSEMLPDTARQFLGRIARGAGRLDRLITDVLNYSKISRGEMLIEKVDIEKLTREIIDTYPNLRESGATILVQAPMPVVWGNTGALTQCMSNLLSNAVKFVTPGTKAQVRVRTETRGDRVRCFVEDNGIGISEEGRQRIFRMFQRLNLAVEFEGSGIGLTIVRKAVERMGGQLGVESTLGSGSVFWIELQRA